MLLETIEDLVRRSAGGVASGGEATHQLQRLATSAGQHVSTIASRHGERARATFDALAQLQSELGGGDLGGLAELGQAYLVDAWQRGVLAEAVIRMLILLEMEEHTIEVLQTLRRVLELPPLRVPGDQPESSTPARKWVRRLSAAA